MNNTVTSTSTELAATAKAVKIACDKGVEALTAATTLSGSLDGKISAAIAEVIASAPSSVGSE